MEKKLTLLNPQTSDPLRSQIIQCYIDIVSSCNLKCSTCAVGNMENVSGSLMKPEKLLKIVQKFRRDYPHLKKINLFNWSEPFIHPKLPELVEIVKKNGFECFLSTNLHYDKNLEGVIKKEPDDIRISVSGFTQPIYEKGHANGNIETVKKNMRLLSDLIKKHKSSTKVTLFFLKYRYNVHEIELMKQYAFSLGFYYDEFWAFLTPVEKVLEYIKDPSKANESTLGIIPELEFNLILVYRS